LCLSVPSKTVLITSSSDSGKNESKRDSMLSSTSIKSSNKIISSPSSI
jgi:hypothetical protein